MSNHSGSYMLNSMLVMLERESFARTGIRYPNSSWNRAI